MSRPGLEDRGKDSLEGQSSHQSIYSFGLQAESGAGISADSLGVPMGFPSMEPVGQT